MIVREGVTYAWQNPKTIYKVMVSLCLILVVFVCAPSQTVLSNEDSSILTHRNLHISDERVPLRLQSLYVNDTKFSTSIIDDTKTNKLKDIEWKSEGRFLYVGILPMNTARRISFAKE